MMCVNALYELFGFTDSNANANDLKLQTLPAGNAIELISFMFTLLLNQPNTMIF
jgi:hypothetical protein